MLFVKFRAYLLNNRAKKDSHRIIENIKINKGDIIADIGSGGGYFVYRFLSKVFESGKVFGVDTNKSLLLNLSNSTKRKGYKNIETILSKEDNCNLPEESCDIIFMRNVFHHIENPKEYFSKLKRCLKPTGRIVIIDYLPNIKGLRISYTKHCTNENTIIKALGDAGFHHINSFNFLYGQSFNIFRK